MPMKLIQLPDESNCTHVSVEGEVTTYDFVRGDPNPLESLLGEHWAALRVLLNFDRVPAIDSAGVGWLISSQQKAKNAGGKLTIHSPQPAVQRMLAMLRIEKIIPVAPDAAAASALMADVK